MCADRKWRRGSLVAADAKALIGPRAVCGQCAAEGWLAAEFCTHPAAAFPYATEAALAAFGVGAVSFQVAVPVPAPLPYVA